METLHVVLQAVGPALVIQLMFELQQKRLGTDRSEYGAHIARCPRSCNQLRLAIAYMLSWTGCQSLMHPCCAPADLPTIVVAAASFDDMIAITGCGCIMVFSCWYIRRRDAACIQYEAHNFKTFAVNIGWSAIYLS